MEALKTVARMLSKSMPLNLSLKHLLLLRMLSQSMLPPEGGASGPLRS